MTVRRAGPALLVGVLLVVSGCSIDDIAAPPPTPLPAQPECAAASEPDHLCIVVLGDSIAAGVPLTGDDRWWVRMKDALADALPDRHVEVENWAVPRSRVEVLESAARDQDALESFDIAIVIEGVNDVGRRSTQDWLDRYTAAVEQMEQRGLSVVVAAPPPNFEGGSLQGRHDEVDDAVRGIADADRPLLDIADRFRVDGDELAATYYSDNLHQGDAGQQVIADMATDVVLGLVGR